MSTNRDTVGEDVSQKVLEVNKHTHTKSCRKYDTQCRFLYPKYPFFKTLIAVPIEGNNDTERKDKLKKPRTTFRKVGEILNDVNSVDEIIR